MNVLQNDSNQPLTLAEIEACRQFEQSQQAGEALFHPQVAAGQAAPDCVAFLEKIGRFAVTVLEGRYSAEEGRTQDEQWYRHEADGTRTPVDNPLEAAWQAAKSVRMEFKRELDREFYTIAVAWFPDMEPDEVILNAAEGRSVRMLFGQGELVQRLVSLPKDDELQPQLNSRYIKQEMAVLSRSSAGGTATAPSEDVSPSVKGRVGALVLERVETVNIYITMVYGGDGDDPPLITVQGR